MDKEQRDQIIKLCKDHIDDQGSVRVGWAAEKILGAKPQHNVLDKVAAILLQAKEYVKEPANPNFRYDWNIRRNPDFKIEKWTDRNPLRFEIVKGLITAVFSIIVSVTLSIIIINKKDISKGNPNNGQGQGIEELKDSLSTKQDVVRDSSRENN